MHGADQLKSAELQVLGTADRKVCDVKHRNDQDKEEYPQFLLIPEKNSYGVEPKILRPPHLIFVILRPLVYLRRRDRRCQGSTNAS